MSDDDTTQQTAILLTRSVFYVHLMYKQHDEQLVRNMVGVLFGLMWELTFGLYRNLFLCSIGQPRRRRLQQAGQWMLCADRKRIGWLQT
jgi:hypothetical protein